MSNKLHHRGLLTESLARAFIAFEAKYGAQPLPLRQIAVLLYDRSGRFLAKLSLADTFHAVAFDVHRNDQAMWSTACAVEIAMDTPDLPEGG